MRIAFKRGVQCCTINTFRVISKNVMLLLKADFEFFNPGISLFWPCYTFLSISQKVFIKAFKRGVLQCCTMIITPVVKENAFGLFFFLFTL